VGVRITCALGLTLIAVAVAVILAHAPLTLAGTNGIGYGNEIAGTSADTSACQTGEKIPKGTSAVRLSLGALLGPTVSVKISSGGRVVATGSHHAGWVGINVAVPITRVARTVTNATICIRFTNASGLTVLNGEPTERDRAMTGGGGEPLSGRMSVEYLRRGDHSWWSMLDTVTTHMGFGHAPAGAWGPALLAVLLAMTVGIASWSGLRSLR
jgi:hypothetical protein